MNYKRLPAILLVCFGAVLMLSTNMSITGGFLGTQINQTTFRLTGFFMFISGFVLMLMSRTNTSTIEKVVDTNVEISSKFLKNAKRHLNSDDVQEIIRKIRQGLGKPKHLKEADCLALRVDKGARVLYELDGETITLLNYQPSSNHDNYWRN